jgi:ribosomal protein S18 acetylase RimI-like enzyme
LTFETVAANLREQFRIVAAGHAGGEVREYPGVSIASSAVAFNMFNAAFLSAPVDNQHALEQRILLAAAHFQARGLPWAFWVCEDFLESRTRRRSRGIFEKYGLRFSNDLPGMVAATVNPPGRALPVLDLRRVAPGPVRDDFCGIGSVCFNVPLPWFQEVFDTGAVWDRFAGYVGYVDQEPVATAAVVYAAGVPGVYNVATTPGHRQRGYGEAVMRQALDAFAGGCHQGPVILQSTPAGLRLYQRMGFRQVATVAVYSAR